MHKFKQFMHMMSSTAWGKGCGYSRDACPAFCPVEKWNGGSKLPLFYGLT